ncbi:MAG TPA: hypothetical protein PLX66_03265 [Bacilli bacterium]|nr:hypothetical protein [Bacilli bacterium]
MKKILKFIPHLTFSVSLVFITLLILDKFNPAMDLLNNPTVDYAFWVFCILTAINAIILIIKNNKEK